MKKRIKLSSSLSQAQSGQPISSHPRPHSLLNWAAAHLSGGKQPAAPLSLAVADGGGVGCHPSSPISSTFPSMPDPALSRRTGQVRPLLPRPVEAGITASISSPPLPFSSSVSGENRAHHCWHGHRASIRRIPRLSLYKRSPSFFPPLCHQTTCSRPVSPTAAPPSAAAEAIARARLPPSISRVRSPPAQFRPPLGARSFLVPGCSLAGIHVCFRVS